jgi:hypothetical protein
MQTKMIVGLVFKKNAKIFSPKIGKFAKICYHNIGPRAEIASEAFCHLKVFYRPFGGTKLE